MSVVAIMMTSKWARWRLKSQASPLFTQPFIQTQIKENIKAPRHWPLCGEFTGDRWIPAQRASYAENVSIWWRHHVPKSLTNRSFVKQIVKTNNKENTKAPHHWPFVRTIHKCRAAHKGPMMQKTFHCRDVIMNMTRVRCSQSLFNFILIKEICVTVGLVRVFLLVVSELDYIWCIHPANTWHNSNVITAQMMSRRNL